MSYSWCVTHHFTLTSISRADAHDQMVASTDISLMSICTTLHCLDENTSVQAKLRKEFRDLPPDPTLSGICPITIPFGAAGALVSPSETRPY